MLILGVTSPSPSGTAAQFLKAFPPSKGESAPTMLPAVLKVTYCYNLGCDLRSGDSPPGRRGNVRRPGGRGGCISQHGQPGPADNTAVRKSLNQCQRSIRKKARSIFAAGLLFLKQYLQIFPLYCLRQHYFGSRELTCALIFQLHFIAALHATKAHLQLIDRAHFLPLDTGDHIALFYTRRSCRGTRLDA